MAEKRIKQSKPQELGEEQLSKVQGGMNKAELVEYIYKNGNIPEASGPADGTVVGAAVPVSNNLAKNKFGNSNSGQGS